MNIQHQRQSRGGVFVLVEDGVTLGEMSYGLRDGAIGIDHTWVNPDRRGEGLARALVDAGVAWARQDGLKVLPLCSYVVRVFDEDASLEDLRVR